MDFRCLSPGTQVGKGWLVNIPSVWVAQLKKYIVDIQNCPEKTSMISFLVAKVINVTYPLFLNAFSLVFTHRPVLYLKSF